MAVTSRRDLLSLWLLGRCRCGWRPPSGPARRFAVRQHFEYGQHLRRMATR